MRCLKPPKREGECAPSVRKGRCWVALHWAGTARTTSPARRGCHRPRSSGILYPKRLGRLPPLDGDARTCTTEPEETKHPILQRRRLVAERPSVRGWQDLRAVYSQTAVCGAFRMHSAHILPEPARFRMHGTRILPRTGDFPVRGHFRDAWSAKLATDCRPGTHFASIFPSASARERTVVKSCHE